MFLESWFTNKIKYTLKHNKKGTRKIFHVTWNEYLTTMRGVPWWQAIHLWVPGAYKGQNCCCCYKVWHAWSYIIPAIVQMDVMCLRLTMTSKNYPSVVYRMFNRLPYEMKNLKRDAFPPRINWWLIQNLFYDKNYFSIPDITAK